MSSVAVFVSACASVSNDIRLLAQSDRFISENQCHFLDTDDELQFTGSPLDGRGFVLTSWNIYKQQNAGWSIDLEQIASKADLLLLQEVRLDAALIASLESHSLQWNLNPAFHQDRGYTGVMTAARLAPSKACAEQIMEPWLRLPKTSIVSYYPVTGHAEPLLIANIHGVNFTLDEVQLTKQLQQLGKYIREHKGPMIVAGDFNTWSQPRQNAVQAFATEVGLRRIIFTGQQPVQHFGRSLDHIYIRGLKDLTRGVKVVNSSDHYPLTVTLAIEDDFNG